jgi:hypothetical protein
LIESKESYNELWNSLKIKNVSPESIDSLNKIIQNKSDLIVRFSNDKQNLMDQIDILVKQKEEYNEQLKYIDFSIYFRERLIIDFETIKDQWYSDYKAMISTFNETLQNLTINLVSFLLRTLNVVIYIIL